MGSKNVTPNAHDHVTMKYDSGLQDNLYSTTTTTTRRSPVSPPQPPPPSEARDSLGKFL